MVIYFPRCIRARWSRAAWHSTNTTNKYYEEACLLDGEIKTPSWSTQMRHTALKS